MIIKIQAPNLTAARFIAERRAKQQLQYLYTDGFMPNATYVFGDFDTSLAEALLEDARYTQEN